MKLFKATLVIAISLSVAFGFILNWAMSIDYTPIHQSMMPAGIAFLVGVFALSSWGGVLGAYLDMEEN